MRDHVLAALQGCGQAKKWQVIVERAVNQVAVVLIRTGPSLANGVSV